jgi:diadenylate cyclase
MTIEIQDTILKREGNSSTTEEEFLNILRSIAPGTNLRTALDSALKVGKGALIAVENDLLNSLLDGGFRINARFTPQRLTELTKMDGAIILSKDMKRINYANVTLYPNSKTKSSETGTRHKAGERTAKQAGTLVIAISERKKEITLFYKNKRYLIISTDVLLRKTNEQIQILEKQRDSFDFHIAKLNNMELRNQQSLSQAVNAIQKGLIIQKISDDLNKHIIELGKEGSLLKTRLKEITFDVENETDLILKDYSKIPLRKVKSMLEELSYDETIHNESIFKAMGYETQQMLEQIKGWRLLSKTSLTDSEVAMLIKEMGTLGTAIHSNISMYTHLLGPEKAQEFRDEVSKIKIGV